MPVTLRCIPITFALHAAFPSHSSVAFGALSLEPPLFNHICESPCTIDASLLMNGTRPQAKPTPAPKQRDISAFPIAQLHDAFVQQSRSSEGHACRRHFEGHALQEVMGQSSLARGRSCTVSPQSACHCHPPPPPQLPAALKCRPASWQTSRSSCPAGRSCACPPSSGAPPAAVPARR